VNDRVHGLPLRPLLQKTSYVAAAAQAAGIGWQVIEAAAGQAAGRIAQENEFDAVAVAAELVGMIAQEIGTDVAASAVPVAAASVVSAADTAEQTIELVAVVAEAGIVVQGAVIAVVAFAHDIAEIVPEDEIAAAEHGTAEPGEAAELVDRSGGGLADKAAVEPEYKAVVEPEYKAVAGPGNEVVAGPGSEVAAGPGSEVAAGPGSEVAAGPADEVVAGLVVAFVAAAPAVAHMSLA
jgi:hypothetical protein